MSTDHPSNAGHHRDGHRRLHGWVLTLDAAGSACAVDLKEHAVGFGDMLQPYGGAVTLERDQSLYRATFSIGEPELDVASALTVGCRLFRDLAASAGMPTWPIVHAEITQVAEHTDLRIVR